MTKPQRDYDEELWNIMSALSDSVLEATDEEILEETEDIEASNERTRAVLLGALDTFRKRKLQEARAQYEQQAATPTKERVLPSNIEKMKELLARVFSSQPQLAEPLTAQFRDYRDLPDSEVESYLRQLAELGVIDEFLGEEIDGQ